MLLNVIPQEKVANGFPGELISGCTRMEPENRYDSVETILTLIRNHLDIPSAPDTFDDPVLKSYLPPGFRAHSPVRMLLASLLYFITTFVFLSGKFETNSLLNWTYRILLLIPAYLIILFSGNYRNIWGKMRYYQHHSKFMRITLIIMIDLGIFFIGFLSVILIENAIQ